MTLLIGLRCKDGAVLACDSQETRVNYPRFWHKVNWVWMALDTGLTFVIAPWHVAEGLGYAPAVSNLRRRNGKLKKGGEVGFSQLADLVVCRWFNVV